MKTLNKQIILAISIILSLTGIIYTAANLYKGTYKVITIEYFNEYFNLATFKNEKVALLNKRGGKISSPKVNEILKPAVDSLSLFISDKKYGYLNTHKGIISINACFDRAWDFDVQSGLAAVVENSKIGFINHSGNYVINPQYKYDDYYYDDITFSDGFCIIPAGKGEFGVINTKNELVLPFIYNSIEEFIHDYKIIQLNGQYGLVDSLFKVVVSPQYDNIALNHQGIIPTDYQKDKQFMLAFDYKAVISEYAFDYIEKILIDDGHYGEDYEIEHILYRESGYSMFTINEKQGVLDDKTGKIIIQADWGDIQYHSEGVFLAQLDDNYFLINTKGEIIN